MHHSLLISDLYLNESRPDVGGAFSDYCQTTARQSDELFILGDLADAWLGSKDGSSIATLIRDELSALTVAGVNVYVLVRDSDYIKGREFSEICGVNLMRDPSFEEIDSHQTLLVHGDTMCIDDQAYTAFIDQIKNPKMQKMLQSKAIDERRKSAALIYARNKSADNPGEINCKVEYVS